MKKLRMFIIYLSILLFTTHSLSAPIKEEDLVLPNQIIPEETPNEKFDRCDDNEDELMSFDEFLHLDYVYEQIKKEEFERIDLNKDGKISKDEYDNHFNDMDSRREQVRKNYFENIFEEFDKDGDKSLSEDELIEVFRKRFILQPRNNFGKIINGFDVDSSGGLDINEYMKMDSEFPFDQTDPIKNDKIEKNTIDKKKLSF